MNFLKLSAVIVLVLAIVHYADCNENKANKDSSLLKILKQKEYDANDGDEHDITDDQIETLYAKLKTTRIGRELLKKELDEYIHLKFYSYLVKEYEKELSNHERNARGFEALGR